MRLTVIGARGFIGSAIAAAARARRWDVCAVSHDRVPEDSLGTVVYCSGLAWGAEQRPLDAYRLHVFVPVELLATRTYDRFIYVSSARVYDGCAATDEEAELIAQPSDASAAYASSKMAGEAAVLGASDRNVVVRPSNAFGANLRACVFLSDIVRQAVTSGRIEIRTALASSKDYVAVEDVADLVLRIAAQGTQRVYNLAAGRNTTHAQLIDAIGAVVPVRVIIAPNAPQVVAPEIDVRRIRSEFGFAPRNVVDAIPSIVRAFQAVRT